MTRKDIEAANTWQNKRNELQKRIEILRGELEMHLSKCDHWTHRTITLTTSCDSTTTGTYYRCEWCGKEWE